jgi:hypothetical protein
MYTFLLCTYTSTVSALTLILTLALSLLYINTYTTTASALTMTHWHCLRFSLTLALALTLLLHYYLNQLKRFFPLQSAHYARVVQELYGLYVLMMVESSFGLLYKPLDFARHNIHLQVSVEVIVSNVPRCIDTIFTVAPCMLPRLLYNPTHTLFAL